MLPDPAEQEDVVVHREPEEDAEQEQRDPGVDAGDLLEAEDSAPIAVLED